MPQLGEKSLAFYERAKKVMPGGVSSNYRYYGEEETPVVERAKGGHIYDFDGKRYIDYRLGWGPIILGHAHDFVNERVTEAIQYGLSFAGTQKYEVSVAERMIDLCPGVEMVRFSNTGSEATMHAMRLARGYTGRDLILKFEGSYHGAHDSVLWSTPGLPVTPLNERNHPVPNKIGTGIPDLMSELMVMCRWNDVEMLGEILEEKGEQIAGIIIEPVLGNSMALTPHPDYFQFLRGQCDKYGIVLIYDEVKTGFRIAPGGAGEYFGVLPDLSTFAKAMGNGYPIAAIGGKKDIMMHLMPGKVFQGGTYSGNVVSTAAADATLERIQSGEVFVQLNKIGGILMDGISEILTRYDIAHHLHGTPAMFGITLSEQKPHNWRELNEMCNIELYSDIISHMIDNGVMPEDEGEPWFLCADHTEADAAESLQKFEDGVKEALK
ncbi:guanitoxin biosynthesis PLP-dependent transaminase GntE [Anaerolineales bacterium HSG6]|nr:guanitoxin biosynthesis PLP-dependent transaminase GntE [Anaerolineales bacterium HSG6]MDM8529935.1 guanitoxin biosynthesis PLP-dependent transaminase GntE [Anaerolineales bacterium HSG25]